MSEQSLKFAKMMFDVIDKRSDLDYAKSRVPAYTAQYEPRDFYKDEEYAYHKACDALYNEFIKR